MERQERVRTFRAMLSDISLSERRGPIGGDRLDTSVREIMRPGVIVLADDASVVQAQRALVAHGVHAVLVLERGSGRAVGWVTSRGLLPWLARDAALAHARAAVTEAAVVIEPSATAREALEALQAEGVTRLLVTRHADSLPEGVVADVDLLRLVVG
jgi:CBS domain-containing protein